MKSFGKYIRGAASVSLVIVLSLLALTSGKVFAAETTYVVNLRERIISDIKSFQGVQEETKYKKVSLMKELDRLKNDYADALTEEQKNQVRLQLRKKKAEYIEADAQNVMEGLRHVKSISNNIGLLNAEYKREGKKDGLGLNNSDMKLVQKTLMGFDRSLALLKSLKPDNPEYALAEDALITMNATYRERFRGKGLATLENMVVYLQDVETYLESMKRYLQISTRSEKIKVYGDIKNELTGWMNTVFNTDGRTMVANYERMRELDEMMSGEDKQLRSSNSNDSIVGTGVIGRW